MSSSIGIAFKGIGTEKQLYFEYLNQSVELHFSFVNQTVEQNNTFPEPFNASYIILSVVVSFLVLFLSNYARIHRFDALSVQWWFAFVYAGLFLAYILILDFTNGRAIKYTQYILAGGLSVVSVFFLAGEFAYSAGLKHKVCKINVRDIFGLLVVGGFVVWRVESGNTWYINDLLSTNGHCCRHQHCLERAQDILYEELPGFILLSGHHKRCSYWAGTRLSNQALTTRP